MTHRYRFPALALRRVTLVALILATAAGGAALMLGILGSGGLTALELVIFGLFVPTFTWIVVPFWTAVVGFVLLMLDRDPNTLVPVEAPGDPGAGRALGSRTALAIPVFDEQPDHVAARVSAMLDGLSRAGHPHAFDVHILSDTRNDRVAREELAHVDRLRSRHPSARIHYRRRPDNAGRKAGNLAEFTARCRDDYDFMVVLDADSLMSGASLVAMVRRMEANPDVGLLQAPTGMIRARSFFARALQFAGTVYGPVLAAGQAFWQGPDANYWGHNAIVRMDAFADEARLPVLPGDPPLGGEVLSHDFVEAALLRRAGWRVVLDPTIGQSFEELPESLPPYARRDRRWAQGSLQHLRLLALPGLRVPNRLHFLSGAMAYVSSLLWLGMLLAGTAYVFVPALSGVPLVESVPIGATGGVSLLLGTVVVLFLPKVLGLLVTLRRDARSFGGPVRLVTSALVETTLSIALAPVLMIQHSIFVLEIVAGRSVGWNPRMPGAERIGLRDALRHTAPVWAIGLVWTAATLLISPLFAAWMSPIFVGLLLAPLLVQVTSGPRSGRLLADMGLLVVPEETNPSPEVAAVRRSLRADPREPSGVLSSIEGGASGTVARRDDAMYNAERGLFDLKRGRTLRVVGAAASDRDSAALAGVVPEEDIVAMAVEGLDAERLERFLAMSAGPARLVVTLHRARLLGWYADSDGDAERRGAFAVPLAPDASAEHVVALSMDRRVAEGEDVTGEMAGPAAASALSLARLGRLLPAVV
ncbi:MAG TPA: glucans biosynthesis glucosyltransferase MdoH, partial [Longimicrobiales bacterium]|nr:glucans biosynthesis glucosyltransferase MdoH [Longimicrobiales bacterium]